MGDSTMAQLVENLTLKETEDALHVTLASPTGETGLPQVVQQVEGAFLLMLKELRLMNLYLASISGEEFDRTDVDG